MELQAVDVLERGGLENAALFREQGRGEDSDRPADRKIEVPC